MTTTTNSTMGIPSLSNAITTGSILVPPKSRCSHLESRNLRKTHRIRSRTARTLSTRNTHASLLNPDMKSTNTVNQLLRRLDGNSIPCQEMTGRNTRDNHRNHHVTKQVWNWPVTTRKTTLHYSIVMNTKRRGQTGLPLSTRSMRNSPFLECTIVGFRSFCHIATDPWRMTVSCNKCHDATTKP